MIWKIDKNLSETKKFRNFRICITLPAEYMNIWSLIHQKCLSVCHAIERNLKAFPTSTCFPVSITFFCTLGEDFSNTVFELFKDDEGMDDGKLPLVTEHDFYLFYSMFILYIYILLCNPWWAPFYMPRFLKWRVLCRWCYGKEPMTNSFVIMVTLIWKHIRTKHKVLEEINSITYLSSQRPDFTCRYQ